jgi:predicted small secreted protein
MSRIRALVAVLVVAFALTTAACADTTGPSHGCDITNSNTCH